MISSATTAWRTAPAAQTTRAANTKEQREQQTQQKKQEQQEQEQQKKEEQLQRQRGKLSLCPLGEATTEHSLYTLSRLKREIEV